jgi:excinuclease ABC subunit B
MYADSITESMRHCISETGRRRVAQAEYNRQHGITPTSIVKRIDEVLSSVYERDYATVPMPRDERDRFRSVAEREAHIASLQEEMRAAAANLDFERAARLRDRVRELRIGGLGMSAPVEP